MVFKIERLDAKRTEPVPKRDSFKSVRTIAEPSSDVYIKLTVENRNFELNSRRVIRYNSIMWTEKYVTGRHNLEIKYTSRKLYKPWN